MTDRETAVEAMAKAAELARPYPRDYFIEDAEVQLDAFLAHITASGWQIVPVVAADEWACSLIKTNAEDFEENPGAYLLEIQNLKAEYDAFIAAAPQFPGREGK